MGLGGLDQGLDVTRIEVQNFPAYLERLRWAIEVTQYRGQPNEKGWVLTCPEEATEKRLCL
jgi:hypothetical protein